MFGGVKNHVSSDSDTVKSAGDSDIIRAVMQSLMKKQSGKAHDRHIPNNSSETNKDISENPSNKDDGLEEWVDVSAERVSLEKSPPEEDSRRKTGDSHSDGTVSVYFSYSTLNDLPANVSKDDK